MAVKSSDEMGRVFVFCVVLVVLDTLMVVGGQELTQGTCNSTHDTLRNKVIEDTRCQPREVFVPLSVSASYLHISPSSVWVKRCVGLCNFQDPDAKCAVTSTRFEGVPVRIYNVKTNKDSCSMYNVEVHDTCRCCIHTAASCSAPRVFNPRKCGCHCPDRNAKWMCQEKRDQNMKWDRFRCVCEERQKKPSE